MGQMDEDVLQGGQPEDEGMIEGRIIRRHPADRQCINNSSMEGTSTAATTNPATESHGVVGAGVENSSTSSSSSGCSSTVGSTNSSQVTSPIKEDSGVGNSGGGSGVGMDISSGTASSSSRSISQEDNCLRMTMSSSNSSSSVGVCENVPQVAPSTFSTYYRANDLNGHDCDDDDEEDEEDSDESDDDRSEERILSDQGSLSGKEDEIEDTSTDRKKKDIIKSSPSMSVAAVTMKERKEKKKDSNNHLKKNKKKDRERKKGFSIGLSLSGLSKVFHNNNNSGGGRGKSSGGNSHHHQRCSSSGSSTEHLVLMNNQICPGSTAAIMSTTHSNVSKSSSESNIPMCHNSLDNLIDDLPSSRSTDSSCLLTNPEDNIDLQIRARRSIIMGRNPDSGVNGNFGQFGQDPHDLLTPAQSVRSSSSSAADQQGQDGSVAGQDVLLLEGNSSENNNGNEERKTEPMSSTLSTTTTASSSLLLPSSVSHNNTSSGSSRSSTSSSTSAGSQFGGPKFKLISEGDVQVCKVKHGQNLMSKLTSSKLLRRWETHHLYLNDSCISSKTPIGCLSNPIAYWQMEEVYVVVRWDSGRRYVIRIVLPDGSLLLQGSNAYVRDQWYHSIQWKKNIFKYHNLMRSSKRPEVILKELKSLVDFATITPLQDDCISHVPIEIVSNLLDSAGDLLGKTQAEEVLVALAPLLERSHPPPSLCRFFSRHCRTRPRCPLVNQLFTPVVRRALKHNVDFGKYPYMRRFIQDYIQALNCHNDGINVVRNFVKSMHGPASSCPHPRVMSNLVSVCLAAIFAIFERNNAKRASVLHSETIKEIPWDEQLLCYMAVFDTISEFEDWRPSLAQLLQPIPFPDDALTNQLFTRSLSSVIRRIGSDNRCDVHQMVMGIRDGKEGWFHLYSTSNLACSDDGELWGLMLGRLLSCCCRRKRFLVELGGKLVGSCLLLALREHAAAQEALCLLLEWKIIQSEDQRVQIATTLQSTPTGSAHYAALCSRQLHLKELQQKGGPRKLTLPSRATDADLAKLLSCGSFGNLECLSLAFTQVTSACAEQLIKLPSLRYLNLWSTQFGDAGLSLISEHLPNIQVLNLCETPVTDKGLLSLTCLTSLRKLNLNSTHLSAQTFASLKEKLPALKEVDVRYTDAW